MPPATMILGLRMEPSPPFHLYEYARPNSPKRTASGPMQRLNVSYKFGLCLPVLIKWQKRPQFKNIHMLLVLHVTVQGFLKII